MQEDSKAFKEYVIWKTMQKLLRVKVLLVHIDEEDEVVTMDLLWIPYNFSCTHRNCLNSK